MSFITIPVLVSQFESIPTPSGGNTAVGVLSLSENLTGYENTAFGENALRINSTGFRNVAIGANAAELNQDGDNNVSVGRSALRINTSGNDNVAIGTSALISNVASANTAVGHAAANALQSGTFNVAIGYLSGAGNIAGSGNTAIGVDALSAATGSNNTAIGFNAGELITTGQKNTIVGTYNGNQGGLDIRTASNYVVLSDGDGNPRLYIDGAGLVTAPGGFAGVGGGITLNNRTGAYTVVASDAGKAINCTANTFTVALTAAATLGSGFACFIWNTGTGTITIDPNGAETIDGSSTFTLQSGEGTQIVCNGTNWITGSRKTMRGYAESVSPSSTKPVVTATQSVAIGQNSSGNGSVSAFNPGVVSLGGSYGSGTDSLSAAIANNTTVYGATGANSIAIGALNQSQSNSSVAIGGFCSASSIGSIAIGSACKATASEAVALGNAAQSSTIGKYSYASGNFGSSADICQEGKYILRRATTDATATVLTTDDSAPGNNDQVILPNNSAYAFVGTVVARQQASGGTQSAAWRIEGLIRREANAASTTLVASTVTVISNAPGWTLALSADTTNGGLAITATGAVGVNIRWVGNIDTAEVNYA